MKNKITLLTALLLCTLFIKAQINYEFDPGDNYGDGTQVMTGQREYKWDIDTLNWDDVDSLNMQYNGKDLLVVQNTLIANTTISGPWKNTRLSQRLYDANNNLLLQVDTAPNPTYGNRYEFTYSNNLEIQKIQYVWNSGTANWRNQERHTTTYTGFDKVNVFLIEGWEFNSNVWRNDSRQIHTYNTQNLDSIFTIESWNTGTSQWEGGGRYLYTYDVNGNQTIEIYEQFDLAFTVYKPNRKFEYAYDGSNRLTSRTEYQWNLNTNVWDIKWKYTYTYNAQGLLETWPIEKWNTNTAAWDLHSLVTYSYDASNRPISELSQSRANNTWENSGRSTFTRDANGYMTRNLIEFWNENTLAWRSFSAIDYWYGPRLTSAITEQTEDKLSVYPNPSNGPIVFVNAEKNLPYSVYDMAGRLVKQGQLQQGTNTVILNDIPGVYLLRAGNSTAKIVKK